MWNLRQRLAASLFGDIIRQRVLEAVKVVDDQFWRPATGAPLHAGLDYNWSELRQIILDCLQEWRSNPLAFRIVALTSDFVVGTGLALQAQDPSLQTFLDRWWQHPQNRLGQRLHRWCDELTRTGELFLVLSRNPADRLSYVREVPNLLIDDIEVAANDLESELRYHQLTDDPAGQWWLSPRHPDAHEQEQVMLHYAINRPVGAVRGLPDLAPILKWLRRYAEWVEDRARLNRYRSAFLWQVQISNPAPGELERKRAQYAKIPSPGSLIISDQSETWTAVHPQIRAEEAADDGKVLRLMVASGAGIPLHFLSEGEAATKATAAQMGEPTFRHYRHRQQFFGQLLCDVATTAVQRASPFPPSAGGLLATPEIRFAAEDLSREDNLALAQAAREIVQALAQMKENGWIDDEHAVSIALRFAGEMLPAEEIKGMLEEAKR